MNRKYLILSIIIVLVLGLGIGAILHAQTTPPPCFTASFGVEVRPEAQAIMDADQLFEQNIEINVRHQLERHQQLTGQCFHGELGQIYGTLPNRVFAVFTAQLDDYGVLRIMTEAQYYPPPFDAHSVGWQYNAEQ